MVDAVLQGQVRAADSARPRHYPNPHNHQILSVAAAPAPPKIAFQIYTQAVQTKMIVRHLQGEPLEKTLSWAESECEGFMRT